MTDIIEKSFSSNIRIMQFFYMYPPEKPSALYKIKAYSVYFLFSVTVPLLMIPQFLLAEEMDMMQANFNAAFFAEAMGFMIKVLPFIRRGEEIKTCINYFADPFFSFARNKKQEEIIKDCVNVCRRNTTFLLVATSIGITMFDLRTISSRDLPLSIWLPFDFKANLAVYCSLHAFIACAVYVIGYMGVTMDPVIGGLAYHATCQLKILKDNLKCLHLETISGYNNNEKVMLIYGRIRKCVYYHQTILKFVELFDECFSISIFVQIAGSAFGMCFCILQLIAMDLFTANGLAATISFSVCITQIYFYCYYGTLLLEEHNTLKDAIYMGQWYEYDVKSKKALITIMERSQKPLVITAGKILELTLDTFTTVIKKTYSLIAVLKNYQ